MKKIFVFIFSLWGVVCSQSPWGEKMQKSYEECDFVTLQNLIELGLKKNGLEKAESYLFEALRIINAEDMPENNSFLVLRYLGKILQKKNKNTIYQYYSKELMQIKTFLETSILLLQQESRHVAAHYLEKNMRYYWEGLPQSQTSIASIPKKNKPQKNTNTPKNTNIPKNIQQMLDFAKTKIGIPYHYGGASDKGYDCSGFTLRMFEKMNKPIPRTAAQQATLGQNIDPINAQPGDLIFFEKNKDAINHVGIVIENKSKEIKMIHASTSKGIRIDTLKTGSYWQERFKMIRRIL